MTLDQRVQQLRKELEETRHMVAIVIGAYNAFTHHQTFWQRLRWLILGPPRQVRNVRARDDQDEDGDAGQQTQRRTARKTNRSEL